MADFNFNIIQDLQENLRTARFPAENLSTIAQKGDTRLVEQFLTENVPIQGTGPGAVQSQLYVACFWGFKGLVKQLLVKGVDVNGQNKGTLWTPLHAATFQEHGPVVMLLLENGARMDIKDSEGRSPKDFASASEKIWIHFAARNLNRTSKAELMRMGIWVDKQTSPCVSPRRPGEGIKMADNRGGPQDSSTSDPYRNAALNGDVLAQDQTSNQASGNPHFSVWK
ncbi:uncharacterized protein LOC135500340 isoform X2 [Lineus longissimus]|uniref:uncharacterized protein LOC135500340 isoform X2 n=1 Tax=Lineus longissimus TaxID=88925 RepID=UPI002B4EBD50